MSELLPCKECQSEPFRTTIPALGYSVECPKCGINVPFPPAPTREAGDQYWNKYNKESREE